MATRLRDAPLPDYDADAAGWSEAQANALRGRRFDLLDWDNLAEEIADVARRERDKLEAALYLVMMHLLKWDHRSLRRSRSWHNTIAEQRRKVTRQLLENPSLRPRLPDLIAASYRDARGKAAVQTSMRIGDFPTDCPYSFDEIMTRPIEWNGEIA